MAFRLGFRGFGCGLGVAGFGVGEASQLVMGPAASQATSALGSPVFCGTKYEAESGKKHIFCLSGP